MRLVDVYVNDAGQAAVHAVEVVTATTDVEPGVHRAVVQCPANFATYLPLVVKIADAEILSSHFEARSVSERSVIETLDTKAKYEQLEAKLREYCGVKAKLAAIEQKVQTFNKLSENVTDPRYLNVHPMGRGPESPGVRITAAVCNLVSEASQRIQDDAENKVELSLQLARLRDEIRCLRDDLRDVLPRHIQVLTEDVPATGLTQVRQYFHGARVKQLHDIVVVFRSEEKPEAGWELDLQFVVTGCQWKPAYDLAFEDSGKCKVKYNAIITQSSQIDWDDETCQIFLTAGSFATADAPVLPHRKTVDLKKPPAPAPAAPMMARTLCAVQCEQEGMEDMCYSALGACAPTEERSLAGTHIQLKAGTVLKHKGETPTTVQLGEFELDAKLFYHLPSDVRKSVYRVFCMKNTSTWTIMPSDSVSIWFASTYVGKVTLKDHHPPGVEFCVYGGVDDAVSVSSLKTGLFKSNSGNFLTGSSKKETIVNAYEVFNSHSDLAIDLLVTYDLPVSTEQSIKVTPQSSPIPNAPACPKTLTVCTNASDPMAVFLGGVQQEAWIHNDTTGNVISMRRVQPQGKIITGFSYSIEHPVDKEVHREIKAVA